VTVGETARGAELSAVYPGVNDKSLAGLVHGVILSRGAKIKNSGPKVKNTALRKEDVCVLLGERNDNETLLGEPSQPTGP
jgi:hypothetical protein